MRHTVVLALCLFPLAAAWSGSLPNTAQIKDIRIPKIAQRPKLEEFLDGIGRADMKRVDDFRQRNPGDGVPASRKTSAWIGYDDKNLYAVFVCEAKPGEVRARFAKREDIMSDDLVAVILDTYHDHQRAYEFLVNPYGIQADAIETENQGDDYSWDTLWYSEGHVSSSGFMAMMTIPFRSLRFSPERVQTWGIALARGIPASNETVFWPYVTQKVDGFTQQLGNMSGLEGISAGRNIQIIPYGAFGHSHFLDNPDPGVPSFRSKDDFRAGLDAKMVIHDSLTLDVAVNPDFSQVESDDPQVTVNQRYEVYFPEKRPFFLENNGYFATPENLFFSRRIADPEFGARLTGKIGRWNLGFLGIDDRAPGETSDPTDPHRGDHAEIGVVRVQREFAKQSNVGLMITDYEFAGSYNRVESADARIKLNANWTLTGQAIASQTRELDGSEYSGKEWYGDLHQWRRSWGYDLSYTDRSEGFATNLGFVPRVNIRQVQQFLMYRWHPKKKVVLSWGPQLYMTGDFDHHNVQQDWQVNPGFQVELKRSTYAGVNYSKSFERFDGINFLRDNTGVWTHSEYFKRATVDFSYSRGTRVNYDAPNGLSAFRGWGSDLNVGFTFRPISRLKLDEIYYLTRLEARTPIVPQPTSVFVNHLARSRVNYQFNRELSVRLILDYNGVLPNQSLINLDRQKRVTGDVLLTYLIHPGTALYVGYTDRLENLAILPGSPPTVNRIEFPSTTTGRQFFAKVSYLFRF